MIIADNDTELLIVTNNHVVSGEESLEVQFIDGTTAEAFIKGTDRANDLAVITVSKDSLSDETIDAIAVAEIGDSDTLKVGEPAIAIGNALGYGQSVTVGVVSALNRQIASSNDNSGNTFIQTDAAINQGNS
ncbi:MAG: trypsin-like peptidase domain-containing protein, partial [Lachnospiraceae bacterium]|nr:trypsin-like peptidase domain-containing protein [Lachnospiraceae bacterium]